MIKVTQLQCPNNKGIININRNQNQAADDFALLGTRPKSRFPPLKRFFPAPPGCLQYYPDPIGQFKSFGYDQANPTMSRYMAQKYAVCFKRQRATCGIR